MDFQAIGLMISVSALPVLLAITFHEAAHGWVAWRLGDNTAYMAGRVSFNPLKHIDPVGTIVLPLILVVITSGQAMFGYAKPVPVNIRNLHNPRRDMVLVALAGPGSNLLLAFLAALAIHALDLVPDSAMEWVFLNLRNAVMFNLILCCFNMIPLPPLDGGRVAVGLLPFRLAIEFSKLERYGFFIIMASFFLLPWFGGKIGVPIDVFYWLVLVPADFLREIVLVAAGLGPQ